MLFVNKLKVLTLMTCLVLVGQGFAVEKWTDEAVKPGQEGGYYIINNEKELAWIALNTVNKESSYKIKLNADLDLKGKLWLPICSGHGGNGFKGEFDGQGHSIKNVYIKSDELLSEYSSYNDQCLAQNLGFFGINGGGTIKNLNLENVDIYATNSHIDGCGYEISVGGLVGWKTATASTIEGIVISGKIYTSGKAQGVGGLVGNAHSSVIKNSVSKVNITADGDSAFVGGLVGLVKNKTVEIDSCVYAGETLVSNGNGGAVGAVAGRVYKGSADLKAQGVFYDSDVFGNNAVGVVGPQGQGGKVSVAPSAVSDLNTEEVICALNKGTLDENGECDVQSPWSVGGENISWNGSDGFKVTFDADGGTFPENSKTFKMLSNGNTITADEIALPTKNGSAFAGWSLTKGASEPSDLGVVSAPTRVYAVWKPLFTITFDANGGSFPEGSLKKEKSVAKGDVITVEGIGALPESYCLAYSGDDCDDAMYFTGWSFKKNPAENEIVDLNNLNVFALKDTTLYAIWTEVITYTVTFNANEHGKTKVNFVRVGAGESITEPVDPTADEGYKFDGWFTEGGVKFNFATPIGASIILYAHWSPKDYDIVYMLDNGINNPNNPNTYNVQTPTFELAVPSRSGYTFEKWYYDENFSSPATQITQGTTGAKTLYAKWIPNVYTITYRAGSVGQGTVLPSEKEHGKSISLKLINDGFTRNGYTQTGWTTTDGGEKEYESGASYAEDHDLTLFPTWNVATYTITYVCDACTDFNNPNSYTIEDADLKLNNPKYPGNNQYLWKGWYKDEGFTKVIQKIAKGSYGNLTIYGKLLKYYNLTYVLNGSTKANNPVRYHVEDAFSFADPAPVAGYTFGGWFDNAEFEDDAITEITKGSTGDMTLYAKWIPDEYTVTYDAGEFGEGTIAADTKTYGKDLTLSSEVFTREGYTQDGWMTTENGDAVEYAFGATYTDNAPLTLYPHWVINTYTVTYDAGNFGEGSVAAGTKTFDVDFELSVETFTRTGYTQDGWEDVNGDIVSSPYTENADITLYPHWVINTYTVTYDAGEFGEGTIAADTKTYGKDLTLSSEVFTRTGYTQDGWMTTEDGDAVEYAFGATYTENAALTLYPHWVAVYTITYAPGEDAGVTGEVTAGTKTEGEDATLSSVGFTREGYTQTGWKTEDGSVTYAMGATYTTDASVTLYPIWEVETYTITYHNVEGATFETPYPTSYTVEDDFPIALNSPSKTGFNFLGWSLVDNSTDYVAGIAAGSTGEANFYANWELAPSPITVTATSGTFEYDGETHNASCSYEGVIPVGYSITMVPSGSVQNVSEGEVTTSCAVTIMDESGDDVTYQFTELTRVDGTISVVAKTVNYGGIAVITDETGIRAEIDDDAKQLIDIPTDVTVEHVTFNRKFPLVKYATVVLPFSIDTNKVHGAEFYSIVMMKQEGKWVAGASQVKTTQLVANTPYLLFAKEANLTFDGSVTFNTSEIHDSTTTYEEDGCKWTFKGTYEKLVWGAGHPDLGKIYAFSAHDVSDEIKVGKFVKFGAESWIRPMRAYLVYEQLTSSDPEPDHAPTPMLAKSFKSTPSTASIEDSDVPEWIDVVIIGEEDEQTTPIARLNSRTGEIRMMDGWFDMKGRKLNGKPTAKGIYYNNGKRVIVK